MQALDAGLFDSVICTGQFEDMLAKPGHELVTKLTKQEVSLFICQWLVCVTNTNLSGMPRFTRQTPNRRLT